jgi:hypothetical protein
MNPHADFRELHHAKRADNQRIRCADCGRREEENNQQRARCKTSGVVRMQVRTTSGDKRGTGGGRT